MAKHLDRLRAIAPFAVPEPNAPEFAAFNAELDRRVPPAAIKPWLEKQWKKTVALTSAQQTNGAQLPADETLREFVAEYNGRVRSHGLNSLPTSFNALEAFCTYIPPLIAFRILPERDYGLSWLDLFGHITAQPLDESTSAGVLAIPEATIFNYSNTDMLTEETFSDSTGKSFVIQAFSIVRHGSEVTVAVAGGEVADLGEESEKIRTAADQSPPTSKPYLKKIDRPTEAVPLDGHPDLWRLIAVARFDFDDRTLDARYVFLDVGDSYLTFTDDVDPILAAGGAHAHELEERAAASAQQIRSYDLLFDMMAFCLRAPEYFEARADDVTVERRETRYRKAVANAPKSVAREVPTAERLAFRNVEVLEPVATTHPFHIEAVAPEFRIQTAGYWKRLAPDQIGADKKGAEVKGKTWVEKRLTWLEREPDQRTVATASTPLPEGPDPGWLYLMRSAYHPPNVFKVGITRRTSAERAGDLTRESGSPDAFHVILDWPVGDCKAAEESVHRAIAHARVNPNREFFQMRVHDAVAVINGLLMGGGVMDSA